ncbi:MAG: hypothetical protein KGN01_07340 [Patescibacteria group bacterium]|nr:hypothetical protein [Patescibacteria group bacterium]
MNLQTTLELYAGGPGSGCNPAAGKCGRAERASASYIPVTKEKYQLAKQNEQAPGPVVVTDLE